MISKLKYTALSLLIIFAYSAAHAVINGVNVTVTASTLCNNGTIEKNFVGGCPGAWNEGALSVASLGYQPAGTANTDDPDLVHDFNAHLASAYQGMFALDTYAANPHPDWPESGLYEATYQQDELTGNAGAVAFSASGNSIFLSGRDGGFASDEPSGIYDSVGEFQIPTLINRSDLNDRTGIQTATQLQAWRSVYKPGNNLADNSSDGLQSINGLFLDKSSGKLCVLGQRQYDAGNFTQNNMVCFSNAANLAASTAEGYFSVKDSTEIIAGAEAAHAASWMADIPTQWRTALGGPVLWGGGKNSAISTRHPIGPTLLVGTLNSLPQSGVVNVQRHMDFWDLAGRQMGAYYFSSRDLSGAPWGEYEYYNCDRLNGSQNCSVGSDGQSPVGYVVPWINDWLNIESSAVQGFIIPNTRTYVVLGTMSGGEAGSIYKGNVDYLDGNCGGPCSVEEDDQYNKYWLFDLDAILAAQNPWEIFPYEHGYLPFLDQLVSVDGDRGLMINAGFDLSLGRLAIVIKNRAGIYGRTGDVLLFQDAAWQEAN